MFGDRNNSLIEPPAPAAPVAGLPGGHGPHEGGGEIHLLDRLSVLYRYRKVVVTVVLVVLVAGIVQTMTTTPEYLATARVQVDDERLLPGLASSGEQRALDSQEVMQTQQQAMRSRDLVHRVVGPLNLAANPEFNGQDAAPTGFGGAVSSIGARILKPIRGLFGGEAPPAEPAPTPTPSPSTPAAGLEAARTADDQLVDAFLDRLDVVYVGGARTIDVNFVSRDPVLAAAAANELAKHYVDVNFERLSGNLTGTVDMLRERVKDADQALKDTDAALIKYRADQNAPGLANPDALATQELVQQGKVQEAEAAARQAKEDYDSLMAVFNDPDKVDSHASMFLSQEVANWKAQLQARESRFRTVRESFSEGHPDYQAAQNQVSEARSELARARLIVQQRLLQLMRSAESQAASQRNLLQALVNMRNQISTKGIDYTSLQRVRDAQASVLEDLNGQLAEYGVQASAVRNNVWIMERAVAPASPFKPDVSSNLLISLFLGIALAGALAFGLDYLDDTIKTPEDITRKLRVPFLGLVPSVRGDKQPVLSGPVPHDFGEAYRALRTSLVFTSGGESTRIITCTSAQPLEGKTTTACNLAMVLAFGGSRVLLIDADMRRPGVHKALKINNTVGLSHLLVGQARVREAIQRTSDPNFCVMTAGRTPPNPSELLSSERMKQLIANLKQGPFDWVVIDTPPVLAVTDAVILTPLVDGVTFVLGAEMTRRRLAERAVQMLMVSRPKVVGAVLNRVNFDRNKYYYSRYYGYQYKSYYGSGNSTTTVKA